MMLRAKILTTVFALAIARLSAQVVVIDPGHGVNANCTMCDGRSSIEVYTAVDVGIRLRNMIQADCSWTVGLTRSDNDCGSCPTLTQRSDMSNSWGADRFISIHCNAGGGTGAETFWCDLSASSNAAAQAFASEIQTQMVAYGQWTNRRTAEDNSYLSFHLGVLRNNNAIGCLNEIGFVDTPSDAAKLQSNSWRDLFAQAYLVALQNDMSVTCTGSVVPANDACADAVSLTSATSCNYLASGVAGATASGFSQPSCDAFSGTPAMLDVWFSFTAQFAEHTVQVSPAGTGSDYLDAVVSVYSACNNASLIACEDDPGGGGGFTDVALTGLIAGNTYYIRVYDYGSVNPTNGDFNICVIHATPCSTPPATPVIAGDLVICSGESSALSVSNPCAGCGYDWSNGDSGTGISINAPGTYSVSVTDGSGCTNTSAVVVTGLPVPQAAIAPPFSQIALGDSLTLSAQGGVQYHWSTGETSPSITVAPSSDAAYTVTVTDADGCTATANAMVEVNVPTGAKQGNGEFEISIVPNPTTGVFVIRCSRPFSAGAIITVWDLAGRKLTEVPLAGATATALQVDLGGQAAGAYLVSVRMEIYFTVRKIVVKK